MWKWCKRSQGQETSMSGDGELGGNCNGQSGRSIRSSCRTFEYEYECVTLQNLSEPQPPPSLTALSCTGKMVEVNAIQFIDQHNLIIASCSDGTARVYDLHSTGVPRVMFAGHSSSVRGLVHITDDIVVSIASDQNVLMWHAASGKRISILEIENAGLLTTLTTLPASKMAVGTAWGQILVVCFENQKLTLVERYEDAHEKEIRHVVADSDIMVSCSWDKSAKVWDANSLLLLEVLEHNDRITSATLNENFIITGCMDGSLFIYQNKSRFLLQSIIRTGDGWLRSLQIYNSDVVSFIGESGNLSFVSLSSASRTLCIGIPDTVMLHSVVLSDGRIATGGRAGFCGIISPPAQISTSVEEFVSRQYPWSSIAVTTQQYPPRVAWYGVQSGMISLLDACENSITEKNCCFSLEQWAYAHHLLMDALEFGQVPASKDYDDRKSHWFRVLYKHTSKLPMGKHDIGILTAMLQQAENAGVISFGRADEFVLNIENRISLHDDIVPNCSYFFDAVWNMFITQAEQSTTWKNILNWQETRHLTFIFRSLLNCMPFCNELARNKADFYMSPFFNNPGPFIFYDPGMMIITADLVALSIRKSKTLVRRFTKYCKLLLRSREWNLVPEEDRDSVSKALQSSGLTVNELREKLLPVKASVSNSTNHDKEKSFSKSQTKSLSIQEQDHCEEEAKLKRALETSSSTLKANNSFSYSKRDVSSPKEVPSQEFFNEESVQIQDQHFGVNRNTDVIPLEGREILGSELKEEIRAELKAEIRAELKNELAQEVKTLFQNMTVDESRGGLMHDLQTKLREEIKDYLMDLVLKIGRVIAQNSESEHFSEQ